ncbi:MAG: HD domain-containing protein [Chloroflexi bacterium]|nr:HD domain-containing protein [Chloroflexota bacterium]
MNNPIGRLAQSFQRAGFALYLVGGPVRDRILGRESADLDFTTDARPPEIKVLLRRAGADHIYAVGERFGTIGAIFGDMPVEITTYRSETYEPGSRKPSVTFGHSLEGDLSRRDFTVNAITQDIATGRIFDPLGGLGDIARRVIRAVGTPDDRFREDPLRVLRAVRFAAQLDFTIDRDTAAAMRRQATGLGTISAERIGAEMHLIMASDRPNRAIVTLLELGLLGFVIPELIAMQSTVQDERHEHKDVFAHTMRVLAGTPNRLELRWGALLHDVGKPATKTVRRGRVHFYGHAEVGARMTRTILERLRADNRLTDRVCHIVVLHMRANGYEPSWTDGAVRRFIREAGAELDNLLALSRADITSYRPRRVETGLARVAELRARCDSLMAEQDVTALDSPLDGHALMELFQRPPGPWIKPVKQHLLNLVLDGELAPDDTEGATEIARELVERESGIAAAPAKA